MKKISILLFSLITLVSNYTYSQINSIQTFDGKIYSIGDTILGGKIFAGNYLNVQELNNGKSFLSYKKDIAYNKLVIRDWVRAKDIDKFTLDDTLAVVTNLADNKTLYVNVKDGLKRCELIAEPAVRLYPEAPEAMMSDFQACCLRTNELPITEAKLKYYIKSIDKDLGSKCEKDEFEFHAVKEQYQAKLEENIKNFDFDKIYYTDQSMGIDKYDFDRKGFPVKFTELNPRGYLAYKNDFFCSISNLDRFSLFTLATDKAQRANKLRYDNNSYPSYVVYVRCYFKFLDKKVEIKKDMYEFGNPEKQYRDGIVGIKLVGMEFYTEPHVEYNFLGNVKVE